MGKISMPKGAPSIDMTPMVDLAFLLVTFFMLSANFRENEPVTVATPSSISDKEVPQKHLIMVTVSQDGLVYFNATGNKTREVLLNNMCAKYKVALTKEQQEEFLKMSSVGTPMKGLSKYLSMNSQERSKLKWGIPTDSTQGPNELRDWINFAHAASLKEGQADYEDASSKTTDKLEVNDYKPKFVLKVDGKAEYARAKVVIEVFRDLNINNLNFVTSLEQKPTIKA